MLERDLQDYLFTHPAVLFPGETVLEKSREVCIDGKRIDLLFRTASAKYIIELKAVPLTREHIGQVAEYYSRLRISSKEDNLKMVLVAPSIPDYRRVFLEEIGIRCFEIPAIPSDVLEVDRIRNDATAQIKREKAEDLVSAWLPNQSSICYDSFVGPVSKRSLAISHVMLRDSLPDIRKVFAEYEIRPIKMTSSGSQDRVCAGIPSGFDHVPPFVQGGAWWAYAFGESEEMPKNDLPNISAMAMPWSFDLTVNAELRTSQSVMKSRITKDTLRFDQIIREHGELQFQAILKVERQPRFYFWVPLVSEGPGTWSAKTFLEGCARIEGEFGTIRDSWISWLEKYDSEITEKQTAHMKGRNKALNLALRLVRPFREDDKFWSFPYNGQRQKFVSECARLKPLIDFLR
jgi:hypothetical protein